MVRASRTFRIFVSSTFSDLKEERNALQEKVFPRLRELCMQHGCQFQAIDLRWGVSEEAALDQQTMKICLGEIERCQKTTPRPNFIVLLGDRYGWRPLPAEIPADEFEQILNRVSNEDKEMLLWDESQPADRKGWYARDDNAVPPVYCLQPRTGRFVDYNTWQKEVERPLRSILLKATEQMKLQPEQRLKYVASATEQEIAQGALSVLDAKGHVFCFFRTIKGLRQDKSAKDFLDLDEEDKPDEEARARLSELKNRLCALLGANVHDDYEAVWTGSGVTTNHLAKLCDDVFQSLSRVIESEVDRLGDIDRLQKEIDDHEAFGRERAKFFVGRAEILHAIDTYLRGPDRLPFAVFGASGVGKSALIARAVELARSKYPKAEIVFRFIGWTPISSEGRGLLESLCHQVTRGFGSEESTIPSSYKDLVDKFATNLALATAEKPLLVFLDGLNQLSDVDNARDLSWLPATLPEHVRLVVSTVRDETSLWGCFSVLESRRPKANIVELGQMTIEEGGQLLDLWLEDAHRTLQPNQRKEVLGKFGSNGLPLYLKLAFEEARLWKSHAVERKLSPTIPGIIRELFVRLSLPDNHGEKLVSRSLGYLAAAKNGLTEGELLDVLSRDVEVYASFLERARHKPPDLLTCAKEHLKSLANAEPGRLVRGTEVVDDEMATRWLEQLLRDRAKLVKSLAGLLAKSEGPHLPVVLWSRLHFDLEPYLTERSADGTSLLAFYHTPFGDVARERFLAGDEKRYLHQGLARYFGAQALEIGKDTKKSANLRKLSELPYQQTCGEMWQELHNTLTDFAFLEAKCTYISATKRAGVTVYAGVYDLQEDFRRALERFPLRGNGHEAQH